MENTEISTDTDTDTFVVKDDNGNFEKESICSPIAETEDKEKAIADVNDKTKDEGTEILSLEKVEASTLQITDAVKTSKEVVNNAILEASNLDAEARDNIDNYVMDKETTCSVNEESSFASRNINSFNQNSADKSMGESLDADLESVVAEATKVQSQVLKCIIGSKASYIPKTVESSVDDKVESKEERAEDELACSVGDEECQIMKTEAIHIEMKIKDKIEEITIENDEKAEERVVNCETTGNKISEQQNSDLGGNIEVTKFEEINIESKEKKEDENDTIDNTVDEEKESSPSNEQKFKGVQVNTENIEKAEEIKYDLLSEAVSCKAEESSSSQSVDKEILEDTADVVDDKLATDLEGNKNATECSKADTGRKIEESDIQVTNAETEIEETQAVKYSEAVTKEDTEIMQVGKVEYLQGKDEARDDASKKSSEISFEEEESCVPMETTKSSLSQTPDLVKVCEPEDQSAKEQNQEGTNELQQIDDSIKGAERECQGQEVNILEKGNAVMDKATEKTSFEALDIQRNGSISDIMIVDSISGSGENNADVEDDKMTKENVTIVNQKAKVDATGIKNKKSNTTANIDKTKSGKPKMVKTTARKERSKSTIIAGQKIELNSDKAQYLHLTLEQIQHLALKQHSGELFSPEDPSEHADDSHCAVHSEKERKTTQRGIKATAKKKSSKTKKNDLPKDDESSNTNATAVKESLQSPDVIREAEATSVVSRVEIKESAQEHSIKDPPTQKIVRAKSHLRKNIVLENRVSNRSVSVGRHDKDKIKDTSNEVKRSNMKVREKTMKKQDMLFKSDSPKEIDNSVPNKKMSNTEPRKPSILRDGTSKGGLLAPTQSWLLHIGNKTDVKSRSPSPGPKEVKRSVSAPRKITDRSPSPKRRIRDASKDSRRNEKNVKQCPKPQASLRPPRQNSSIRASPEPNVGVKRTGSFKKAKTTGNQNLNSKLSSNKLSTNGNEQNSTEQSKAASKSDKNEAPSKQQSNKNKKAAADKEDNIIRAEISCDSVMSSDTSETITKDEENQNGMNTTTKCDEQSSTTLFQSNSKIETTVQKSDVQGSGVEETSITATEVIEMFESDSKAVYETTEASEKPNGIKKGDVTLNKRNKGQAKSKKKNESTNESLEKSKSLNKSITSKITNILSNQMTTNNGSSNAAIQSVKNKSVKNTTTERESMKNKVNTSISNKSMESSELSEDSKLEKKALDTSTEKSKTSVIKAENSSSSSSTFTEEANKSEINGTANTKVEAKTRTTMIIRLHPGSSKRISGYLEHQPGDPSSDSLNLTEDVKYEDTPGAICGLEISFSSVPQDVDIKLISADEPIEGHL